MDELTFEIQLFSAVLVSFSGRDICETLRHDQHVGERGWSLAAVRSALVYLCTRDFSTLTEFVPVQVIQFLAADDDRLLEFLLATAQTPLALPYYRTTMEHVFYFQPGYCLEAFKESQDWVHYFTRALREAVPQDERFAEFHRDLKYALYRHGTSYKTLIKALERI